MAGGLKFQIRSPLGPGLLARVVACVLACVFVALALGSCDAPPESAAPPPAAPGPEAPLPEAPPPSQSQLPEFPWPPPATSASYVLPDNLLAPFHTVGALTNAILNALEQGGYVERSFFRTEDGGVALVTRLERINDDGTPAPETERWPASAQHHGSTKGLIQFLLGLFYVDPGHYRVIVFVIQDLPFLQSRTAIAAEEAQSWLTTGANALPAQVAARPFDIGRGSRCTALIYEFASDGENVEVVVSNLTGKQHLEKAGLMAMLDGAE